LSQNNRFFSISFWYTLLTAVSLLAIAIYLILLLFPSYPLYSSNFPLHFEITTTTLPLIFIIIFGGIPLAIAILVNLLKGDLGADALAAIALITAAVLNQYLAAALIILMLASGQALESYAMRKASSVLLALSKRMPFSAHRKIKEHLEDIPLDKICIGDHIVIYPHETCPVDGVVLTGHGSMNESYLTGEPYQISKAPGSTVLSGSINGESALIIRADKLAKDSRYANIMQVMEEADQRRPQLRRLGDQIGAIFAPIALLFAIATWYFTGDAVRFLAVLVVATPCPLLIAIPITIISAVSLAARHSIIIKDPTVLERLPTCSTAIFDKTGTLTYGKPNLDNIITLSDYSSDVILQLTASLERYSKHPLASAILNAAEKNRLVLLEAKHVSEEPGKGLVGEVDEHEIIITSRKKIATTHPQKFSELPPLRHGLECIILINNQIAAVMHFSDTVRSDGKPFIKHLAPAHSFNKIMLVSGDRSSEVDYLASLLGIQEAFSNQTPEQKLALVREEVVKAPTLFMGDGINDAPALTAATVGIAFGQNTGVTGEAAGAVVMGNTLTKVDELFHISELMRKVALQSAIGGMVLSFIAMIFAAFGFITPVAGALLQEIIDVLAISNALRLTWKSKIDIDM
jgi:heavy metal translocating P-type ATPase